MHLIHRDPAHLGVGHVCHGHLEVRIDDQHRHRVLLNDRIGSLQKHPGLIQPVFEALLLFLLLLEQRVDRGGQRPVILRNACKVDLNGVVAFKRRMECGLERLGEHHRPLFLRLSCHTRHNRPGE